jgi:hypothetical protein
MHKLGAALFALLILACGPAAPLPTPSPTPSAEGLYLRAWQSQALPPEHTFTWLPMLTITDGIAINGNVAVPAIFPGPLMIVPNVRAVSDAGQAQIIAAARQLGLLGQQTDFTGGQPMPGALLGHIELVVDGVRRELVGDPSALVRCEGQRCVPDPGTPGAFALFWQQLGDLEGWLATQLGPSSAYTPVRVAVATMAPQPADLEPNRVAWPLDGTFADFGQPWAVPGSRCGSVEGEQLDRLLPALLAANQLTRFVDPSDEERSLLARVLVPGEPSPCGEG